MRRPFDERARLCDNRPTVTTFRSLAMFTLLALVAGAGCDKTNDVPRLQDEGLAVTRTYQQRFDDLARRADVLRRRAGALPNGLSRAPDVNKTLLQAASKIEDYRRTLQTVPNNLKSARPEDLQRAIDALREGADHAATEATSDLGAAESQIWIAEQQPAGTAPEPPAEPGADSEGSAAPIR